ncbi:GerAB/ArcD/ProY family transporter [Sutcliffiella horikoshii]|uniref:GerAB/ArcD/ProY family transporter n=1 Tax=Sutcliffiella horikoshii TaxID=79883 RepID=A0AA95B3Y3_9BACI|nr:endospore germination permease [Sutcliffiella horikoshii]TYS54407.1 GerAB/ArcD/ProY family transporter [Sutcliffiella horikoshii]
MRNTIQQFRGFDLFAFTFSSTITLGVAFLPYVADGEIRSAWLKLILTSIPYFFLIWLISKYFRLYDNNDFFKILRKNAGYLVYFIIMAYLILSSIFSTMKVTQDLTFLVRTFMLKTTPTFLIILPFILLISLAVHYGLLTIVRFVSFFVVAEILLLATFLSWGLFSEYFNWIFIPPVMNVELPVFLKSSMSDAARYGGIVTLLGFIQYVKRDEKTFRAMSAGLLCVMLIYVTLSLVVLGIFGYEEAIHLISPIITLVQSITPSTGLLERMDLLFLGFWVISFIKVSCILFWFSIYLLEQLFPKIKRSILIVCITPLFFIYANWVPFQFIEGWQVYNINVLVASLLLPCMLLLFVIAKHRHSREVVS